MRGRRDTGQGDGGGKAPEPCPNAAPILSSPTDHVSSFNPHGSPARQVPSDHLHFANREVKQSAPCDRTWEDWNSRTGILEA